MKYATQKQIIEAAKTYGKIGRDSTYGMYTLTADGVKKYFGRNLYIDSLHNLATAGVLRYCAGEWAYESA